MARDNKGLLGSILIAFNSSNEMVLCRKYAILEMRNIRLRLHHAMHAITRRGAFNYGTYVATKVTCLFVEILTVLASVFLRVLIFHKLSLENQPHIYLTCIGDRIFKMPKAVYRCIHYFAMIPLPHLYGLSCQKKKQLGSIKVDFLQESDFFAFFLLI